MKNLFSTFTILLSILMFILTACKKSETIKESRFKAHTFTSFSNLDQPIQATQLGISNLNPGAICISGDTLFIADNTANAYKIIVYNYVKKQKIATLSSWKINDVEDKFSEPINHISVGDGKLFVSNNSSRVDVFNLQNLQPISTVGVGVWWGNDRYNLVHAFASYVKDSLLFVRDKSSLVMFKLKDITTQNYKKVPIFAKSKPLGYNYNNLYHDIKLNSDSSSIILTDRNDKALYFVDTKKVKTENNLDLLISSKTINLPGIPASLEAFSDSFLISFQDGSFMRYDFLTKAYIKLNEQLLRGKTPRSITRSANHVWVMTTDGWIFPIQVETKTIKEYSN